VVVRTSNLETFRSNVRAVIPHAPPITRTRAVRLVFAHDQLPHSVAINESVSLLIPSGPDKDTLTVLKDAILVKDGRSMVYVVNEGIAVLRAVELGREIGSSREVLSGLELHDRVVIRGNERLAPNLPVSIVGGAN